MGQEKEEIKAGRMVVGIIGLGMIGGSLAGALKKNAGGECLVLGFNRTRSSVDKALERGLIDEGVSSEEELAERSDIVVIATPVGVIPQVVEKVADSLRPGTIITDAGSTKAKIVEQIEGMLPPDVHFIGGHPMAGSEREGVKAADPDLLKNAYYLLTPTAGTDMKAFRRLHSILAKTGANILAIDPERHDEAVAVISHLPHLVAAALMNVASSETKDKENILMLAAGGFRDTTRIAAGNTRMWVDICLENRQAIASMLERFQVEMKRYLEALDAADERALADYLEEARRGRLSLAAALDKTLAELYELYVPVIDRPGIISDVTLTVGRAGVNIEGIEILHATESSGTLLLTVAGEEAAEKAAVFLRESGYDVDVRGLGSRE
ncbi:MAG: prephenate dehydrogenase/arogenate dehydrogenase family protein [Candidatus Aquicultorales bacterium]